MRGRSSRMELLAVDLAKSAPTAYIYDDELQRFCHADQYFSYFLAEQTCVTHYFQHIIFGA